MSQEIPKIYTPEEREDIAEKERSRTITEADLLSEGARYEVDEAGNKHLELSRYHQELKKIEEQFVREFEHRKEGVSEKKEIKEIFYNLSDEFLLDYLTPAEIKWIMDGKVDDIFNLGNFEINKNKTGFNYYNAEQRNSSGHPFDRFRLLFWWLEDKLIKEKKERDEILEGGRCGDLRGKEHYCSNCFRSLLRHGKKKEELERRMSHPEDQKSIKAFIEMNWNA